jgi:glycerol-3-phosphate dehydrogenase
MKTYDIIIIGAGVVGTAIARELSKYVLDIAVLEKEAELSFGVSKSNSGIIHPGTQNPAQSLKGPLCVQGNRLVREIAQECGVDFKEVGELIVAFHEEELPLLMVIKEEAEKLQVPGLRIVQKDWLRKYEPNLSQDAVAALHAPTAGIISPYRLVYDMAENAIANGIEFYTAHPVQHLTKLSEEDFHPNPLFDVVTPAQTFRTRYVINAAGLYADEVAGMLGLNDFRITPRKGEEFILDKKKENMTNHLLFPLPSQHSKGILVIKTSDGNPMIGPTVVDQSDKDDWSTTDQGLQEVVQSVRRMVPSIDANDIIAYFAGLRPVAGEDFIIRHEERCPGLINVAGIQSPGLTAAPAIALYVSDLLRQDDLNLTPKQSFHRYRKKSIHLFSMPFDDTEERIKENPAYGDIVCRCELVSAKEITDAIDRGATTLDGIKFRTRAQAGRCHGGFCTTRIMKMLADKKKIPLTQVTKKGPGSEIIMEDRIDD